MKVPELLQGMGPQGSVLVMTHCCVVFPGSWEGLGEAGEDPPSPHFLQLSQSSLRPNISSLLQGF